MSEKRSEYCSKRRYATTLVFAAGPNANDRALEREPASSMRRTYSARAKGSYEHFREYAHRPLAQRMRARHRRRPPPTRGVVPRRCVCWTMRAALDGMIDSRCDIALLAMISCGLYAGPHRRRAEIARRDSREVARSQSLYADYTQVSSPRTRGRRISGDFVALMNELLAEPIGPSGEPRGAYFERVVLVKL